MSIEGIGGQDPYSDLGGYMGDFDGDPADDRPTRFDGDRMQSVTGHLPERPEFNPPGLAAAIELGKYEETSWRQSQ